MSLTFYDAGLGGSRFDFATGRTIFDSDLKPGPWRRVIKYAIGGACIIFGGMFAYECLIYGSMTRRRRRLLQYATDATTDLDARAKFLISIVAASAAGCKHMNLNEEMEEENETSRFGAFMTNAQIFAIERNAAANKIIFFANGGWAYSPHQLTGQPLLYKVPSSSSTPFERDHWWLALTLGKSLTFNGSFAFILATLLIEQSRLQSHSHPKKHPPIHHSDSLPSAASPQLAPLTFRGQRVVNIGIGTGSLTRRKESSTTPSFEVVCEIGTIDEELVQQFHIRHPFQRLDLLSPDLIQVCQFDTRAIFDHWHKTKSFPSRDSMPHVLWEKKVIQLPTDHERWIAIELEDGEKMILDLVGFFTTGETEDRFDPPPPSSSSPTSFLSSLFHRVRTFISSSFGFSPQLPPLPSLHVIPLRVSSFSTRAQLETLNSSIIWGAHHVIKHLQDSVLINSDGPNDRNTQMRWILRKTLQLWNLPLKHLLHRVDLNKSHSHHKDAHDMDDGAYDLDADISNSDSSGWGSSAYHPNSHSKKRESGSERARRAKKSAQKGQRNEEDGPTTPTVDEVD